MPEVCEVTLTTMYLEKKVKNKKLEKITVIGGKYKRTPLKGLDDFNKLLPLKIKKIDSKGKQMWIELDKNNYIMIHFGMDGRWSFEDGIKNSNIELSIKDIGNLFFVDSRNFGRFEFITTKKEFNAKIDSLGPDLLKERLTYTIMKDRMKKYIKNETRYNKKIIKVLMEGQKADMGIGSGIGNYLACEILYRAEISPHTPIGKIYDNNDLLKRLTDNIKYVIKLCYMTNKTGYMKHIKDYLETHAKNVKNKKSPDYHKTVKLKKNEEFNYLVYRLKRDRFYYRVKAENIIGKRTTYWVPMVQK